MCCAHSYTGYMPALFLGTDITTTEWSSLHATSFNVSTSLLITRLTYSPIFLGTLFPSSPKNNVLRNTITVPVPQNYFEENVFLFLLPEMLSRNIVPVPVPIPVPVPQNNFQEHVFLFPPVPHYLRKIWEHFPQVPGIHIVVVNIF